MDEINENNIQEKINLFQQMQQQAQAPTQQTSQIEMSINEIERTISEIEDSNEKSTPVSYTHLTLPTIYSV